MLKIANFSAFEVGSFYKLEKHLLSAFYLIFCSHNYLNSLSVIELFQLVACVHVMSVDNLFPQDHKQLRTPNMEYHWETALIFIFFPFWIRVLVAFRNEIKSSTVEWENFV